MSIRSIAMTVACSVAGLFSVSEAKADPYYWGAGYGWGGYGYSSYYAPSYSGYYAGYYPSYWSGYSPYFSTSFYAPSYSYAAYPAYYGYGYGNSCCSSCCNSCGPGGCGVGGCGIGGCGVAGCGVPDRPAGAKSPTPDSGPQPTYEPDGKGNSGDSGFKSRTEGAPTNEPASPGSGPAAAGEAEEQKTFKPPAPTTVETDKPVVIPQKDAVKEKAPISAPPEGIPASPDVINGPKTTTPPAAKDAVPATPAPPADKKVEPKKPDDKKVEIEDLQKPEENVHPAPLQLDAKVTWRNAPSRSRLALQSVVDGGRNVRQSTIYANRNWVPVGSATTIVKK